MDVEAQSFEREATKGRFILEEEQLLFKGRGFLGAQPLEIIKVATAKNKERNLDALKLVVCYRFRKVKNFCNPKNIRNK